MENLWPDFSNLADIKTPKEILEEQAKLLPKLTNDMIYASVEKKEGFDLFNEDDVRTLEFRYYFFIRGKFLDDYRFCLFKFYHNIDIYPVVIKMDNGIEKELGYDFTINIGSQEEFIEFIKKVFNTKKLTNVIASIISLSK